MASTPSTRLRDEDKESDPLSGIATPADGIESCESPDKYDVFINHRGPDVKQILAIPLHDSLAEVGIQAYLDIEDNDLGDSISSKIKAAIISASVHIAIFSTRYAQSAWCLAELTSMLRTGAPIIPVFCDVKSSGLRHDLCKSYAEAFSYFKEKGRYLEKLEKWKESLAKVSDIMGVEATSQDNMNELCQKLVSKVKEKLAERDAPLDLEKLEVERRIIPLEVASYKVGLDRLVQDFDNHCQKLEPERGNMIGIFGLEGSGKTTLAKELFNRKCSDYTESSFLFNVREASVNGKFTSLQDKLLRDLFHTLKAINDVGNGVILLQSKLKSLSSFLIVVDGVATPKEVNSLVPLYTINSNSLVIVTAREESVLEKAGISVRYEINKMGLENGKRLFSRHAFQEDPPCGCEDLVEGFVGKCEGLPLSLQLLGGHALCMSQNTWQLELDRIQGIVPGTLHLQCILELSYKTLKDEEKDIFLDIACFFVRKEVEMAKRLWKGLGWDAERALKNLRDRYLVDVVRRDLHEERPTYVFRMHDVIREFGAKEAESGKFKRVWCRPNQILESHNFTDIIEKARNDNFRCLNSIADMRITFFLGHSMESAILQWLELTSSKCIPLEGIPLKDLEVLRVITGLPKKLWQSEDEAPCILKELLCRFTGLDLVEKRVIEDNWSIYSTSIGSLSELECLILKLELSWEKTTRTPFEIKWNSFLETVMRDGHIKTLALLGFYVKGNIDLSNSTELTRSLESLTLSKVACKDNFNVSISGKNCPALKYLKIEKMEKLIKLSLKEVQTLKCLEVLECHDLESILGNDMVELEILCIDSCSEIEQVPRGMSGLKRIRIMACEKLQAIEGIEDSRWVEDITITRCCSELQTIKGLEQFKGLKFMILSGDYVWKCFSKRLPLAFAVVMGKAATTSLDTVQIQNEMDRADYHCKFESREEGYKKLRSLQNCQQSDVGAIILCAMVDTKGPTYMDLRPHCGETIQLSWGWEEKMIYTIVVTDPTEISMVSHSIPGLCWMPNFKLQDRVGCSRPLGQIKEGHILAMKNGREHETLSLLKNLTNQLYN